ncbi:MAG: hypothetical protein IPK83_20835 [Planctomycetes bacterium]|nr:hypothetical protein [Planctomycetota bacterium]
MKAKLLHEVASSIPTNPRGRFDDPTIEWGAGNTAVVPVRCEDDSDNSGDNSNDVSSDWSSQSDYDVDD